MKVWNTNQGNPQTLSLDKKPSEKMPDKCWSTGVKQVTKCELVSDTDKPTVTLPVFVQQAILSLVEKYPHTEWLAYLHGCKEGNNFIVTSMEVPKQEVSCSSVDVLESKSAIGTIHSHHTMGAFHSNTDDTFIGGNHEICLVVDSNGNYVAKCRRTLPCGSITLIVADVLLIQPRIRGVTEFVEAAASKIQTKTYQSTYYYGGFFCGKCHELVPVEQRAWHNNVCYHVKCLPIGDADDDKPWTDYYPYGGVCP